MTQILLGSLLLSAIHALIPNHWIPLVAIGRAEGWSRSETLTFTGITGLAHVTSTILIGVVAGLLGHELSTRYAAVASVVAPAVLIGLGVVYLVLEVAGRRHQHHHFADPGARKQGLAVLARRISLRRHVLLSLPRDRGVLLHRRRSRMARESSTVSLVYLVVTVAGMVVLVDLGLKGAARIQSHFLEHHEKAVTGLLLIALGALAYFVEL